MATLYKRGDIYWTRFFDADGKRQARTTGKTEKREAMKEAQRLEVESRSGTARGSELPKLFASIIETAAREAAAGELTLGRAEDLVLRLHRLANPDFKIVSLSDHLNQWVKSQTGVTESTAGVYEDTRRHIVAAVGAKVASAAVGDFTTDQAVKALQKLKNDGLKSSTVNMDLRALRRALHAAVKQGLAKANVAADIKPFPEDDSDEVAPFTASEVRAMIDHPKTSEEWRGMIIIGAHTGLRLSDVAKLTRAHIEGTKLVIRPKKTTAKKKTITIPLSPPALGWIGERQGPLFPSLCKRVPGTLSTTFRRIMESAGVPRHITEAGDVVKRRSFHSLRHSFASWMAEADIHSDVRQKLTGHSSAGIHARYTHHDEALDRAVGTLPSL